MLYPIGTKIDLKTFTVRERAEGEVLESPKLYQPGTRVVFVKTIEQAVRLSVTPRNLLAAV